MTKTVIVVSSCDAFKDCWEPFLYSVKKYLAEMPYEIYIISNFLELPDDKIAFIKVGEDKGWASNLKKALTQIDADYILYMQEDYWLTRNINTDKFRAQVDYCNNNGVDYLRLSYPYCDKYRIDSMFAMSPVESEKYALCLQPAIWKKETLEKLLIEGWSGWDYEAKVCQYVVDNKIPIKAQVVLSYGDEEQKLWYVDYTAVRKGKWTRPGAAYLRNNGFERLLKNRKTEGWLIDKLAIWRNIPIFHPFASGLIRMLNKFKWNI